MKSLDEEVDNPPKRMNKREIPSAIHNFPPMNWEENYSL
jgi:hypothetical protein